MATDVAPTAVPPTAVPPTAVPPTAALPTMNAGPPAPLSLPARRRSTSPPGEGATPHTPGGDEFAELYGETAAAPLPSPNFVVLTVKAHEGGFGMRLRHSRHKPGFRVTHVAPHSLAETLGLARGDLLYAIDNSPIARWTFDTVVERLASRHLHSLTVLPARFLPEHYPVLRNLKRTLLRTLTGSSASSSEDLHHPNHHAVLHHHPQPRAVSPGVLEPSDFHDLEHLPHGDLAPTRPLEYAVSDAESSSSDYDSCHDLMGGHSSTSRDV